MSFQPNPPFAQSIQQADPAPASNGVRSPAPQGDGPTASPPPLAYRLSGLFAVLIAAALAVRFDFPLFRTVVSFAVTLGILVFVHEWGHYQFARWAGMKVNRFGIGFPPWVYSKNYKGIEYSIGALPIGGMVDIAGLGSEEEMVATVREAGGGSSASGASQAAPEPSHFDPAHYRNPNAPRGQRQFQDASLGWRFWTLFAGPLMNFVFAFAVFVFVFSFIGVPDPAKTVTTTQIETVQSDKPAAAAGLQAGDRIIKVNGFATPTSKAVSKLIQGAKGAPVEITVLRHSRAVALLVHPIMQDPAAVGMAGSKPIPFIGIEFYAQLRYQRVGFLEATQLGAENSLGISEQILTLLGRAVTFRLTAEERSGIGGPIKIAQAVGDTAKYGITESVVLMAALSVNLGLLNLFPFPALDGGRILFLGYELIMRRPLDPKKEGLVHMVGMVVLLAFILFISARDALPMIQHSLHKTF